MERTAEQKHQEQRADRAFVFGLVAIPAWFIPLVGFPVGIIGLMLGFKSLSVRGKESRAVAAVILCILSLIATSINAYVGAQAGKEVGQQLEQQQTEQQP